MLSLILNAAERRVQFLFVKDKDFLYAEEFAPKQGGTDLLITHIQAACKKIGYRAKDITHIASVAGPGNFMGIRLTMSISSALARSLNPEGEVLQAPLDYLQCLAANVHAKQGEIIRVLTSGTRETVHMNDFCINADNIPMPLFETKLISFEACLQSVKAQAPHYILGSGADFLREETSLASFLLPVDYNNPFPSSLQRLTEYAQWENKDIAPIYLRECDAIQNLDHIANMQGVDPAKAHSKLHALLEAPTEDYIK